MSKLGQHFLNSRPALNKIIAAANIKKGEAVLEIGPGKGALTKLIIENGAKVVAVEKDRALVQYLYKKEKNAVDSGALKLITGDIRDKEIQNEALKQCGSKYKLVANIPYYLTGIFFKIFLTHKIQPARMVILIQKEVAERIIARNNKESLLSIGVKAYSDPTIVARVKRGSFFPPPKVDSAVLLVENISRSLFDNIDENKFWELVRAGFKYKRKMLISNIRDSFDEEIPPLFDACKISKKIRAEDMHISDWKCFLLNSKK